MPLTHSNGFSTAVRISLEVNGQVLRVSQVGRDSLILRDPPCPMSAGDEASIVISVDGARRTYPIVLRNDTAGDTVYFDELCITSREPTLR